MINIPKMTDNERRRVLVEWNDTYMDYPGDVCLHQLFEAQEAKTPNALAVVFEGAQLTYRELNRRANNLAHYLQRLGVGPEVLVGIFMERSLEMIIGIYGTLKAGGAYVPLDPEYPMERVAFMLEDTNVSVLLTQERLVAGLPEHGAKLLCVDADRLDISKESADNPVSGTTADNLAYVIYTSGSTGKPKGVMNCHRGVCNRLLWMQEAYKLSESDSVLQKTPFSFDVSVWEFFWPLLVGARLIVAPPGKHKDSTYLVKLIADRKITTIHFVPTMLQIFLEEKDLEGCKSLKRIICSGEELSYMLQERFFAKFNAELHNLYGPTEAAIDVTYWACQNDGDRQIVPIGRPVANTQIYVLDQEMQPVPVGIPGELYIGGVQVARGYLNRPELTAERFVADPFSDKPGARLYKSGDKACYLPGGELRYLGRVDHQVKINGVRIELGEIESFIKAHPDVKQAVVAAREDEPGNKRLVAYLVPKNGKRIVNSRLLSYLQKKLPGSMIPSAFVMLDVIPTMPNGKIDRHALPAPGRDRPELDQAYIPPKGQLDMYLASLWREILYLDRIGIHDRFFELGGTSIKAAQFINKLQQELDENIYIVSIFEAPSIAEYRAFLEMNYADAIIKKLGVRKVSTHKPQFEQTNSAGAWRIDSKVISQMHKCIPSLKPRYGDEGEDTKNPPAIFILAPPRSGTTLLRVMLAGHPDLFASTELQLLGFNTLEERRKDFSGKFSLWLEGTVRAIMEIKNCDVIQAKLIMEEHQKKNYTTKQFYRILQDWIGDKILVDKSPSYAIDINTLEKAERDFDNPLYIYLVRHPYAMVDSFVRYHIDQALFLRDNPFSPRELGELVWLISNQNILQFLQKVPDHRKYFMQFEDLVKMPKQIMEEMCLTLRLKFHPDLTKPYKEINKKMVDGIYKDSKPMGDTRLLDHLDIDPKVAERWKGVSGDNFLSDITWELAVSLGYEPPESVDMSAKSIRPLVGKLPVSKNREFLEQCRQRRKEYRDKIG